MQRARRQPVQVAQTNSAANQHGAPKSDRYLWPVQRRTRSGLHLAFFATRRTSRRSLQSDSGECDETLRDNAGRTKREHDFFNPQSGLPTMRRAHDGLRMPWQVRQELARGMGVGTQQHEKTCSQNQQSRTQAVVPFHHSATPIVWLGDLMTSHGHPSIDDKIQIRSTRIACRNLVFEID